MSCNYYIKTKDAEMVFDLMPRVRILTEERVFEIHLCQTSGNKKPLFEVHSYKNFSDLCKVLRNEKYTFIIADEYNEEIAAEDFISYMIEMTINGESRIDPKELDMFSDENGFEWFDGDFF